jgi:hypothetical protein
MATKNPRGKIERLEAVAAKVPQYPGRKQAEAVTRPLVDPWARKQSAAIVQRLLGYWLMVQQYPNGRKDLIDLGLMSRSSAYGREADFRRVFGVSVEDFDPAQLPRFFGQEGATEPK